MKHTSLPYTTAYHISHITAHCHAQYSSFHHSYVSATSSTATKSHTHTAGRCVGSGATGYGINRSTLLFHSLHGKHPHPQQQEPHPYDRRSMRNPLVIENNRWFDFVKPIAATTSLRITDKLKYIALELLTAGGSFLASTFAVSVLFNDVLPYVPYTYTLDPMKLNLLAVNVAFILTFVTYYKTSRMLGVYLNMTLPSADPTKSYHRIFGNRAWKFGAVIAGAVAMEIVLSEVTNSLGKTSKEDGFVIEMMMSADPLTLVTPVFIGPLNEELLFRAMLFARLLRSCGAFVAYSVSSLIFGLAHYSADSDKVLECALAGGVMAASYHLTGTLLVPFLTHAINNSILASLYFCISPNSSYELREKAMVKFWQLEKYFTASHSKSRVISRAMPASPLLDSKGNASDFCHRIVDTIVDALDQDNDGKVTASEVAYFLSLDDGILPLAEAAWIAINKNSKKETDQSHIDSITLTSVDLSKKQQSKQLLVQLYVEMLERSKDSSKLMKGVTEYDDVFTDQFALKYIRPPSKSAAPVTELSANNRQEILTNNYGKFSRYMNQFLRIAVDVTFNHQRQIDKEAFKECILAHTYGNVTGAEQALFHAVAVLSGARSHPFQQIIKSKG